MKSLSCVLIYKLSVHGLLPASSLLLPTWSFIRRPQHAISTSHRPRSGLPKPTGRIPHCSDKDALPHWLPAHEHRHFYLQTTTEAGITRLDSSPAWFLRRFVSAVSLYGVTLLLAWHEWLFYSSIRHFELNQQHTFAEHELTDLWMAGHGLGSNGIRC